MASSIDLYVPEDMPIAVKFVLEEAGLEVRSKPKRLTGGARGMEYDIRKGKMRASVLETPGYTTPDVPDTYLLCSASTRNTAMLQWIVDALKHAGAYQKRER